MRLRGVIIAVALTAFAVSAQAQVRTRDHGDGKKKGNQGGQTVPAKPANPPPQQNITVSGFSPVRGPVGTVVTITGTGFVKQDKVLVGGRPVRADSITDTAIVFKIPAKFYDGSIAIRHPGAANDVVVGSFTVESDPVIGGFAPTTGPVGTRVEIKGSGFQNGDQVMFNGKVLPAAELGADRIVVVIPAGAQTDHFQVARGGAVKVVSKKQFIVVLPAPAIAGIAPTSGPPGTAVRITGSNFADDDLVYYGRGRIAPTARTATTIDVVVPANANHSEMFMVKGSRGQTTSQVFTLVLNPTVASFAPAFGPAGTRVVINGAHFMAGDTVFLNGLQQKIVALEEKQITVEIVHGARSGVFEVRRGATPVATSKQAFEVVVAPAIASFSPTGGPVGTHVTIQGSGFSADARVMYGAQQLKILSRNGETSVEVMIPARAANQPFVIETRGGTVQSAQAFQVYVYSTISSVSPTSGPVGTRVWIRGKSFNSTDRYYLNNVELAIVERHPEGYVVQIPAGAQSGVIEWESYGKREASRFRFEVLQPPSIASFSPTSGPVGTQVVVSGANFTAKTAVFYGNLPCRVIQRTLPGGLVVEIPGNAQGTDYLWVEDANTRIKSQQTFQVVAPPVVSAFAPQAGPVGTQVVVTGSNFTRTTTVLFGNVAATIVKAQLPTSITVTVPAGAVGAQFIWVEDRGQKVKSATTFNVVLTPVISTMSPLSGPAGTQVTLTGENFTPQAAVWFGNLACPIVKRVGKTQIVVTIPAGAKGKGFLTVEDNGQRVNTAQQFEVLEPPAPPPEPAGHARHDHAHDHPHEADDHHHHPHAHPHRQGTNHHHPY